MRNKLLNHHRKKNRFVTPKRAANPNHHGLSKISSDDYKPLFAMPKKESSAMEAIAEDKEEKTT